VSPGGQVFVAGTGGATGQNMAVVRLAPDLPLWAAGTVSIEWGSTVNAVVVDAAGRVVLAGAAHTNPANLALIAAARLNPSDLSPDRTFHGTGWQTVAVPGDQRGVAVDPADRVVLVGDANKAVAAYQGTGPSGDTGVPVVARLLGDPPAPAAPLTLPGG